MAHPIAVCPRRYDCCLATLVCRACRSCQARCASVAQTTTIWCLPIRRCRAITPGWNGTARVGVRSTWVAPTEPGSTACAWTRRRSPPVTKWRSAEFGTPSPRDYRDDDRSADFRRLALRGTPHHFHRLDLPLSVRGAADHHARAR